MIGDLTLTLLSAVEVAQPRDGKVAHAHRLKLRVESGAERKEIFLMGESTVLGHTLTLRSAGDAQDTPHAPREAIAVIAVRPAP